MSSRRKLNPYTPKMEANCSNTIEPEIKFPQYQGKIWKVIISESVPAAGNTSKIQVFEMDSILEKRNKI